MYAVEDIVWASSGTAFSASLWDALLQRSGVRSMLHSIRPNDEKQAFLASSPLLTIFSGSDEQGSEAHVTGI